MYIANGNLANPNGFDASKMTEIGTLTSQAHQTLNLPATPIARYIYIKAAENNYLNFLELEAYGNGSSSVISRSSLEKGKLDTNTNVLSLKNEEPIHEFKIHPNPVVDGEIMITTLLNGIKLVTIFDMQGQKVYSKQISSDETVNVSHLNSGIYIIKVLENDILETQKLIIE